MTAEGHTSAETDRTASWRRAAVLAGVAFAAILVYLNSLSGDFVWDDRGLIIDDRAIQSWNHLAEIFCNDFFYRNQSDLAYGYYRPITTLSYLLDFSVWGLRPFGYHLTNVLLHAASSVLVVLVLLRLDFGLVASAVGALLFAVHPIHTENVAWIAGRTDLLAFVFCAIALLLHLQVLEGTGGDDAERHGARQSAVASASIRSQFIVCLSALAFALGLLAKEMSVVLVAWLGLIDLMKYRRSWRAISRHLAPHLTVLAAYLVWRFLFIHVGVPGMPAQHSLSGVILSSGPTVLRYLSWMLAPIYLNAYVQNAYVTNVLDPRLAGSVFILLALGLVLRRAARHVEGIVMLVGMLAVSFVPILNFVRVGAPVDMGNVMAERFCYFPSFPFLALVGLAFSTALARAARTAGLRSLVNAALIAVVGLGALGTVIRNRDWHTELTFLTTTLQQSPTAVLLWGNLATYHLGKRNVEEASKAIETAMALDPNNYSALSSRALWYVVSGRLAEAIPLQERIATEAIQGKVPALNNLAYLYRMTGQAERALNILQQLIREGSGYAHPHFNLAEIYRSQGLTEQARSEYRLALEDRPNDLQIAQALAALEMETGRSDEAQTIYRTMLKSYPDDARILNNVALIQHGKGDVAGALQLLRRAVEIQPAYVRARMNYAQVLQASGRTGEASAQLEEAVRLASGTELEVAAAQQLAALRAGVAPETVASRGIKAQDRLGKIAETLHPGGDHALPAAIVLVTVDTLRADFVSFNGHRPQTTPFLDTLAQKGAVFTEAYAPSSWTVPSMASLFTSLAPSAHGLVTGIEDNGRVFGQPALPDSLTTLAESLKQGGFVTIGVPANLHLADQFGFGQGFDYYAAASFMGAPEVNRQVGLQLQRAFGPEWQTAWKTGKTFLWIHYFDPHDPYSAHEPWINRYAPGFETDPARFPAGIVLTDLRQRFPKPDRGLAERIAPLYESEISFVDDHVRRLSDLLGLADDHVLLIVTADHGEEIADHGGLGHGHTLYQELIHIPLLVHWPGGGVGGVRIDSPVSLLDIYPTLVELLGVNAPSGLQGESLVPLLRGQIPDTPRTLHFDLRPHDFVRHALGAIRDSQWKLVHEQSTGHRTRLFDLAQDPRELHDLSAQHGEVVDKLAAALRAWRDGLPPPPADLARIPIQDEDVLEKLKALGYIN